MKLQNLKKIVTAILEYNPVTRGSDRLLYDRVCVNLGYDTHHMTAYEMLHNSDMPSFESVRRARQKVMEEQPELRSIERVEAERRRLEKEYRAFALEGAV